MPAPDSRPLPTLERRSLPEVRALVAGGAKERRVVGWASKFNTPIPLAGFDEVILPGAYGPGGEFTSKRNVKLLAAHDPRVPLASVRGDTLKVRVVGEGLQFSAKLPATPFGEELWAAIERHDIDGASVGFVSRRDSWDMQRNGRPLRTVHEADLYEISLVSTPAQAEASVDTVAAVVIEQRALDQARQLVTDYTNRERADTMTEALRARQVKQQQVEREAALIQALSPTLAARAANRATR